MAFLQVNGGEPAPDQLKIHVTHCLHFPHHYETVHHLPVFSIFYGLVHQMHANANTVHFKSLSTTSFQVFLGLPLCRVPSTSNVFLPNHPHPFLKHAHAILACFVITKRTNLSLSITLDICLSDTHPSRHHL